LEVFNRQKRGKIIFLNRQIITIFDFEFVAKDDDETMSITKKTKALKQGGIQGTNGRTHVQEHK
jgi:hypothetical protein